MRSVVRRLLRLLREETGDGVDQADKPRRPWTGPAPTGEVCTVNGAKVSCQRLIETLSRNGGAADIPDDSRVNR